MKNGADIEAKEDGMTPLLLALKRYKWEVVSVLIELGADVNARKSELDDLLLHKASLHGKLDIACHLLHGGADIEARDLNGKTPLVDACCAGQLDVMALLLDHGANIESRDSYGFTPIFEACERGKLEAVRMLSGRGANINAVSPSKRTSLFWALARCHGKCNAVIDLLLDRGAPVDSNNMLHQVCKGDDTDLLIRLLDRADIQDRDADGNTVAHGVTDSSVLSNSARMRPVVTSFDQRSGAEFTLIHWIS